MANNILTLLKSAPNKPLKDIAYLTCLAGLANVVLISLINLAAAQTASGSVPELKLRLLYVVGLAIFITANRFSLIEANRYLQQRLGQLRVRIADRIRHTELRSLECLGTARIYATLAKEGDDLSQNFSLLVNAGQGLFLLTFCLLYIAYLSVAAFLIVGIGTVAALGIYLSRRKRLEQTLMNVYTSEAEMYASLNHFTQGFQEIRLNAAKNDALYRRFEEVVDQLESNVVSIGGKWVSLLMFNNAFLYGLLGVVVFVLPVLMHGYSEVIYKIAATAIFCVGPVTGIMAVTPIYGRANAELGYIFALEQELAAGVPDVPNQPGAASPFVGFERIEFNGVCFSYQDGTAEQAFCTGPVDLTLRRGEIVFLRGGNGSGKSTLMKLMCGLYRINGGEIQVDGIAIDDGNMQQYRELFSCIFPDFHLFDRLHGLAAIDPQRVQDLIERMELGSKITWQGDRFSTLKLSTGQRKRLAMIVSLLDDGEVFMFDEWAADQDQHFREIFYEQILPDLRLRNKTVVAVTHDQQYWNLCDRLITLDLGRITQEQADPALASSTISPDSYHAAD